LEFNVPFQHKYSHISEERSEVESCPSVLLSLALVLGLKLSLRTHLKSLALALKVESLLALILNIFKLIFI